MSRRIVRLTLDLASALGESGDDSQEAGALPQCRSCLFWQLDPVRRAQVPVTDREGTKDAWLTDVLRDWGSCGRVALVDDRPVGWAIYAPSALLPGADAFPTAPVSADAVLLTTVYVRPADRGGGLGRMLIQGMARDLLTRHGSGARVPAVEAFGDTRGGGRCPGNTASSAVTAGIPAEFLGSVGFRTQRAHPTSPRMRMDLRSALTWRDEVGHALDALVHAVRPARQPVGQAHRRIPK